MAQRETQGAEESQQAVGGLRLPGKGWEIAKYSKTEVLGGDATCGIGLTSKMGVEGGRTGKERKVQGNGVCEKKTRSRQGWRKKQIAGIWDLPSKRWGKRKKKKNKRGIIETTLGGIAEISGDPESNGK